MTLTCAITEVSPRSGGAASIECWRAIFSTSCYPHIVPMMNRWLVKRFVLHLYIFHLYLIINKNTEKGMYLVIQERFSSNIWYVTIFCEYPVSLKLLLNILYPNNFFPKYPVSQKPLIGPQALHCSNFLTASVRLWSLAVMSDTLWRILSTFSSRSSWNLRVPKPNK